MAPFGHRATALLVTYDEIERATAGAEQSILGALSDGFVHFSQGKVQVARPAHMKFDAISECPGDACIKCGGVNGSGRWVVKVASGFSNNEKFGLSTSQGVMLVFKERTGELEAVLNDDGLLTNVRTALAAALCVRDFGPTLEPDKVLTVAIFGTGVVAQLVARQLRALDIVPSGSRLVVMSRSDANARRFGASQEDSGWNVVDTAECSAALVERTADVIITCTPSLEPLLCACKAGSLVVALGADAEGKRELGAAVYAPRGAGHRVVAVADSREQCLRFGELKHAIAEGTIAESTVVELGEQIGSAHARASASTTVVVDLTGVAVQDVVIASMVLEAVLATRKHSTAATAAAAIRPPPGEPADAQALHELSCTPSAGAVPAFTMPSTSATAGGKRPHPIGEGDMRAGYFRDAPLFRADRESRAKARRCMGSNEAENGSGAGPCSTEASPGSLASPDAVLAPPAPDAGVPTDAEPSRPPAVPWPLERLKTCLHRRVHVYWEGEDAWFPGIVDRVLDNDPERMRVHVLYDDGDKLWYDNFEGESVHKSSKSHNPKWFELRVEWDRDGEVP